MPGIFLLAVTLSMTELLGFISTQPVAIHAITVVAVVSTILRL